MGILTTQDSQKWEKKGDHHVKYEGTKRYNIQ